MYIEIQADDPKRAIHFYSAVLSWHFDEAKGVPVEYWRIQGRGVQGGLLRRPAPPPPARSGTNAFVCSFEVEDFDALRQKVLASGGMIAMPKFAVPGRCWQGYFIDTEGNTFGLFEVDESAR